MECFDQWITFLETPNSTSFLLTQQIQDKIDKLNLLKRFLANVLQNHWPSLRESVKNEMEECEQKLKSGLALRGTQNQSPTK